MNRRANSQRQIHRPIGDSIRVPHHVGLYALVFQTKLSKLAGFLLLFTLFLQPVMPVFAGEDAEETAVVEETAPPADEPDEPEEQIEPEEVEKEIEVEEGSTVNDNTASEETTDSSDENSVAEEADNNPNDDSSEVGSGDEESDTPDQEVSEEENSNVGGDTADTSNAADSGSDEQNGVDSTATSSSYNNQEVDSATTSSGGVTGTTTPPKVSTSTATTDTGVATASTTNSVATSSTEAQGATSSPYSVDDSNEQPEPMDLDVTDSTATTTATIAAPTSTTDVSEILTHSGENSPLTVEDEIEIGATSTASSSDNVVVKTVYVQAVNDSNKYQFGSQDCVSVGDGSYYCSDRTKVGEGLVRDELLAEADEDGDLEIYRYVDGTKIKVTDNQVDDSAPYFDRVSQTYVWHRLLAGRYQVVMYDVATEEETVLTENNTNDMEPTRSGNITVWQRWIDDNWEVVMFDGEDVQVLTANTLHDVAPHVRGDYIIWNTINTAGEKSVTVYEISTGLVSTIKDSEGGEVTNPRFVLVYDTMFDNGDVVTKGFNPETGELVPLSAAPAELPTEIPEPDQTGETRALLSSKSSSTEDEIPDVEPDTDITDDIVATPSSAASVPEDTVDTETVDLRENATSSTDFALTEYDLVVTPATSTQTDNSTSTPDSVE